MSQPTHFLGIDLGTTSLSAAVIDLSTGTVLTTRSRRHGADLPPDVPGAHRQDPEVLVAGALELLLELVTETGPFAGVGVTGQMHGVLYTDAAGRAVSPAYTWLDRRAGAREGERAYQELFADATGESVPLGYGALTHFTLQKTGRVPASATHLCTPADYLVMRLADLVEPVIDPTLAHSLGLFDLGRNHFAEGWGALESPVRLPALGGGVVVGHHEDVPVVTAIGDNQASFIGSVGDSHTAASVTLGTSGQVTCVSRVRPEHSGPGMEVRPFPGGGFLLVGASLTGGKAFEVLAGLIDSVAVALTGRRADDPYVLLEAASALPPYPVVDTRFAGSRGGAQAGAITGVTMDNLTLPHLVYGFAQGVVDELHAFWTGAFTEAGATADITGLVGNGNALRRSALVRQRLSETFGLPLTLTEHQEEAAVGAALYAASVVRGEPLNRVTERVLG